MFHFLNEDGFDPSYYPVFQQIFAKCVQQTTSAELLNLFASISLSLRSLSAILVASSGPSVDLIWAKARPIVPTTAEHWEIYERFLNGYKDFEDRVAFRIGKYWCCGLLMCRKYGLNCSSKVIVSEVSSVTTYFVSLAWISCTGICRDSSEIWSQLLTFDEIASDVRSASYLRNSSFYPAFRSMYDVMQLQLADSIASDHDAQLLEQLKHLSGISSQKSGDCMFNFSAALNFSWNSKLIFFFFIIFAFARDECKGFLIVVLTILGTGACIWRFTARRELRSRVISLQIWILIFSRSTTNITNRDSYSARESLKRFGKLFAQISHTSIRSSSAVLVSVLRKNVGEVWPCNG